MQSKFNVILFVLAIIMLSSFKNDPDHPEAMINNLEDTICRKDSDELIGKWVMDGDFDTYIKLRSDGIAIEKSIGEPLRRYWTVKNDKLCIKTTLVKGSAEICLPYELTEDILVLTMSKMKLHYARSKKVELQ